MDVSVGQKARREVTVTAEMVAAYAELTGDELLLSAVDPLNLAGVLTPGARITSIHTNSVLFRDGLPSDAN